MADLTSQYPMDVSFTAVDFIVNTPTIVSETNSGKLRRVGQGISFYSWTVKYPPVTPRALGTIQGFIAQTQGPLYSFEIVLPEISYSKTINQSVAPTTSANISAGAVNVTVTGCTVTSEVLRAGDFFKFDNHSKVYQATVNCNSDSNGNATLYFSGPTVSSVTAGANVTITAVPFTAVIEDGEQTTSIGSGGFGSLELSMREVW